MVLVDFTDSCHETVILRQELPEKTQDTIIAPMVLKLSVESSILSRTSKLRAPHIFAFYNFLVESSHETRQKMTV